MAEETSAIRYVFKKKSWIIGILAVILLFSFTAHSVHALSFPAGINYYSQINISNSQTTATPNPFQQMINVSYSTYKGYAASNFQNVEFFYANGTVIPSWLESYTYSKNAVYWLKVGSIPASSSITVYMGFASNSTNLFNTNDVGEAPQLSSTYGEYDDGANVFDYYTNFAGTSLPSGWVYSSAVNGEATLTVNNGITISSSASNYGGFLATTISGSAPVIIESNLYGTDSTNTQEFFGSFSSDTSDTFNTAGGYTDENNGDGLHYSIFTNSTRTNDANTHSSINSIVSLAFISTSSQILYGNYTEKVSSTVSAVTASLNAIGFWYDSGTGGSEMSAKWIRTRAYPPNGVMPSVTFGSVTFTVSLSLYLNGVKDANTTITYGTQSNFTASISPNTDYVSLYVNGVKVEPLTEGSVSYLKTLAAGTYKVTAATNASGVNNVTFWETINKATPTLSATVNGLSLSGSYTIRDANLSLSGSVSPPGLTAYFYDNGVKLGASPQTISYDFANLKIHDIVFNTSGNQNYTSASISATVNLTTNHWIIEDVAQNGTHLTFNLTVSNSTVKKTFTNLAYGTNILYQDLPLGTDTFNFSSNGYAFSTNSSVNSIFTSTNETLTGVEWEWINFDVKVSQTGLALSGYSFNLSNSKPFSFYETTANNPVRISLQNLYGFTNKIIVNKTGYNTTKLTASFGLSASNTFVISVSEAAIDIYVYNTNTRVLFPNATISIANGSTSKTFTNVSVPLFETYNDIPLGNDTITVSRLFPAKDSWTTSTYYATISSTSALNLSTYIFNASDAVTLTFQVQGPYGSLVPNAVVYLESSVSPFDILSECKTLGNGQCAMDGNVVTEYQYYAALPFTDEISQLSPLYTLSSGTGGICPTGVWCSYLTVTLSSLASTQDTNITYTPSNTFLQPLSNQTFSISYSSTKNDISGIIDNYSVIENGTLVSSHVYTFSGGPTKGELSFNVTVPNASYDGIIQENVTILQASGNINLQYIYYIQGSPAQGATNPTVTNALLGLGKGLGGAGFMIFFWIVLLGVTVLVWVLSQSVLATMLIIDGVTGVFAYLGAFSAAIGTYGSYLGWGMFAVFTFFTITYQMTKVGGMG